MDNRRPTWAEIDLDAIRHNIRRIRRFLSPSTRVMAVVKANGYGHGVMEVCKICRSEGVEFLGVATLDEATPLREAGVDIPILVLGYVPGEHAAEVIENDIRTVVYDINYARSLSETASRLGKPAVIHIKIDTGMGRLGFSTDDASLELVCSIAAMPGILVEGMMTHFAVADDIDPSFTEVQLERFLAFAARLEDKGVHIPIKHCSNSAAIVRYPQSHLDMVRAGIMLYGLHPSEVMKEEDLDIIPAMSLKSRVSFVKTLQAGDSVSYGRTYICKEPTAVATVPIGYADGYCRLLSNRAYAIIAGTKVPLIGTVCMDQCMFMVPSEANVAEGDEVVLFGRPETGITADDLAKWIGTINYEIITTITSRVPRVYIGSR